MSIEKVDLSTLARGGGAAIAGLTVAAEQIPVPPTRWKTRILLPTALILSAGSLLAYTARDALTPATPVRVVPVVAKAGGEVGAQTGGVVVQAPGWVEADPFAIGVSALVDGVVREVLVLEGERVEKDQVVARLVDDEARIALQRAEAELSEAKAEVDVADAELQSAQRNWEHPIGLTQAVATAEAKVAEKRAALERWPAELAADQAKAEEMKAEYERTKDLHAKGQTSEIELIRAEKQAQAATALVESIRLRKPVMAAELAAMQADFQAATDNARLRIADAKELAAAKAERAKAESAVIRAEAMAAEARLALNRTSVRSPASGVVQTRLVEPGSRVMLNSDMPRANQLLRLYNPQKLQVRIDIPLSDAAKVQVGMQADVVVQVLPDRTFRGEVSRVVHEADIQRNTLQVKVRLIDPSEELKPEMLARARFLGRASTTSAPAGSARIFVPLAYVHRGEQGHAHVVIVNQSRETAQMRAITLGSATLGDSIEVLDGLQAGDRIIAGDPMQIRDGQRVRVTGEAKEVAAHVGLQHGGN